MRTAYHEQLDRYLNSWPTCAGWPGVAMERATQALLQADLVLAEQVITDHDQISRDQRARRGGRLRAAGAAGAGGR